MTTKPRIAIPLPTATDDDYNERCWKQYADAISHSGGTPVKISLDQEPSAIARQAASCSGVLLPGSPADVHPQRYGQQAHPETKERDALRESTDELLLQDAFNLHKPLLGICYGHQYLNVWRGGSLVQHLQTSVNHTPGRSVEDAHRVVLDPSAVHLQAAYGASLAQVNSSHHQAVAIPGDGLKLAAYVEEDGVVEAVEAGQGFVVGVQWHPERTFATQAGSRRLFADFVEAARQWAKATGELTEPKQAALLSPPGTRRIEQSSGESIRDADAENRAR
jgi:putative glutamine amidotransferase